MAAKSYKHDLFQLLPPELIFDIFSRLRIRDLSQCMFVCKYWGHIIRDPIFIQLHHSRINQQDPDFLFICDTSGGTSKLHLVDHDGNNLNTSLKARPCFHKTPNNPLQIVGSSNGLLCLALPPNFSSYPVLYERIYVCNPITGDTLELPRESNLTAVVYTGSCKATSCGFAFDSTTNAYKVIRTRGYFSKSAPGDRTAVEIYTVGSSRSWRRINDIPTCICKTGTQFQVFHKGALHWYTYYKGQFPNSIAAIHVAGEQFKAFKMPPPLFGIKTSLCLLEDCLCMIYEQLSDMVIWVMKEYAVETSWKQRYIISIETLPWRIHHHAFEERWVLPFSVRVARQMSDGSVLLHTEGYQYYCDFEHQQYKAIKIDYDTDCQSDVSSMDLVVHVGCLISPTSINRYQTSTSST